MCPCLYPLTSDRDKYEWTRPNRRPNRCKLQQSPLFGLDLFRVPQIPSTRTERVRRLSAFRVPERERRADGTWQSRWPLSVPSLLACSVGGVALRRHVHGPRILVVTDLNSCDPRPRCILCSRELRSWPELTKFPLPGAHAQVFRGMS